MNAHLVAHQSTQNPATLSADPAGDAAGPDLARLGDHDVAVGGALQVVVEDVLWELRALATARGAVYDHHGIASIKEMTWNGTRVPSKLPQI